MSQNVSYDLIKRKEMTHDLQHQFSYQYIWVNPRKIKKEIIVYPLESNQFLVHSTRIYPI